MKARRLLTLLLLVALVSGVLIPGSDVPFTEAASSSPASGRGALADLEGPKRLFELEACVGLQRYLPPPNAAWEVPQLAVTIYPAGGTTPVYNDTVSTDSYGGFYISFEGNDTHYDIVVKGPHTLSNRQEDLDLTAGLPISMGVLLEGDASNNNYIDVLDYSIIHKAFFKERGDAEYDERADFNQDGIVDILDYSLFHANFWRGGPIVGSWGMRVGACPGPDMATTRQQSAQAAPSGTVYFTFYPSSSTQQVGQNFWMQALVNPSNQPVSAAQVKVKYDPRYLQVTQVIPGTVLTWVFRNSYNNSEGSVTYAAGAAPGSAPPRQNFSLVTIVFRPLAVTPGLGGTPVNYLEVSAVYEGNSYPTSRGSSTVIIVPPADTPTPTETPTETPTPTPVPALVCTNVFDDLNNNRIPEPEEPALPGAVITFTEVTTVGIRPVATYVTSREEITHCFTISYPPGIFYLNSLEPPDYRSLGPRDWGIYAMPGVTVPIYLAQGVIGTPTPTWTGTPPTATPTFTAVPSATPTATLTPLATTTPSATPAAGLYLPLIMDRAGTW